jgi:TolB-like protein/DNA-binding winged helix-turn-helix (wHTH) protein/tetratricopeptide (TPR) repeat protein
VRFSNFELDLESGELRREGTALKLQPQPAKVLVMLVSHAGEVITRNQIAEQVWGSETFVDFEQGLNFAIRQIRTVLGDGADQPHFLETLPRRGYRFIAPVERVVREGAAEPTPQGKPRTRMAVLSAAFVLLAVAAFLLWRHLRPQLPRRAVVLAVLPFDDLSGDPQEYLVNGLTEEMIAHVTQISPEYLRVIARTSAMQYEHTKEGARQIGQELGADYILENSIRHEGGRLRVTSQLVRTADQTHLWAESYNRDERDLLPLESEVTEDIAEQVRLHLLPSAAVSHPAGLHPVSPEAHELYLKGEYSFNQRSREGLQQSVEYFNQAVAKEPGYAAAYAGLANAYNLAAFYGFDPSQSAVAQAKIAADKALQLDASLAAAHAALAYTEFMFAGDWQAAEREFRRAVELDDNYVLAHQWYALYLAGNGRVGEAVGQMQYAQRLDPLSPSVHTGLAYVYYFTRDYDQAIQQGQVALQLNPNFTVAHAVMGWAYTQQRRYPEAIAELQTAARGSGANLVYLCGLGRAYALSGNTTAARKIMTEVGAIADEPRGTGSALAAFYLALGDSERALRWLEQTAPGDIQANWLRVEPAFDPLRSNPRFQTVLNRIGKKRE